MAKDEVVKATPIVPEIVQDYSTFGLPTVADPFARLQQRLEISNVETWDFEEEGDLLALVVAKADRFHEEFGRYPYLTVQLQNGDLRGVAMVGLLLTQAGDRCEEGDLLAIRTGEKVTNRAGPREYNNHTVAVIPKGEHEVGVQPEKPF